MVEIFVSDKNASSEHLTILQQTKYLQIFSFPFQFDPVDWTWLTIPKLKY